jgi:hypothetical protein
MKLLALTSALITIGAVSAHADPERWEHGRFPYEARHHHVCQEKAERLHHFERRASADGRIDHREREIIERLRHDLRETCGGYRWRG